MGKKKRYTEEESFNIYVSLGENRTYQQVADITGYAKVTIEKKGVKYGWATRLKELSKEQEGLISAFVTDNSNLVALSESMVYKSLSESLLKTLQASMPLLEPSSNPRDLKTLLDIYRLINGQATNIDKQEVTVTEEKAEELSDSDLAAIPQETLEKFLN